MSDIARINQSVLEKIAKLTRAFRTEGKTPELVNRSEKTDARIRKYLSVL